MAKWYLALVGAVYCGLGVWCSVQPTKTSGVVGFTLQPGSGQSEFLVVYGGLEFALGLIFLLPLIRSSDTSFAMLACLILHACLVGFRTVSFFLFQGIGSNTYTLAAAEWLILVLTAALWFAKVR